MTIELQKRNGEAPNGKIILYDDYIVHSDKKSFEELIKELSKRHDLKAHEVFSKATQLLYFNKEEGKIVISEDRKIDLFRLAQKKGILNKLQKELV
tara:strand:+ start:776 stop:1063 length:288 start_codon:yes stop_codon:yes gene_type:complete